MGAALSILKEFDLTEEQIAYCKAIAGDLPNTLDAVVIFDNDSKPTMSVKSTITSRFNINTDVPVNFVVATIYHNMITMYQKLIADMAGRGIPTNHKEPQSD